MSRSCPAGGSAGGTGAGTSCPAGVGAGEAPVEEEEPGRYHEHFWSQTLLFVSSCGGHLGCGACLGGRDYHETLLHGTSWKFFHSCT